MPLTLAQIDTLLADNTAGDISAADMRSVLAAVYGGLPSWMPATVGNYDDYFDEDNESDWTATAITGSATWNYNHEARFGQSRGLAVAFEDQTAVDDVAVYLKSLSGIATGDYIQTAVAPVRRFVSGTHTFGVGLILTDGNAAGSEGACVSLGSDANVAGKFYVLGGTLTAITSAASNETFVNQVASGQPIHFRLTYTASNTFRGSWSLDGDNFTACGADITVTFTPTHGGLFVSTVETEPSQARFAYFHSNVTP